MERMQGSVDLSNTQGEKNNYNTANSNKLVENNKPAFLEFHWTTPSVMIYQRDRTITLLYSCSQMCLPH